jgi:hypothetical protein
VTLILARGTREVFDPTSLVEDYLDVGRPRKYRFSWPFYDALVTNGRPDVLVTGDYLAPSLLGAPIDSDLMAGLVSLQQPLQEALAALPAVEHLADATDADCDAVAALWAVLDLEHVDTADIKPSLVAKVLHRKRPGLVPVWDSRVFTFYRDAGCVLVNRGEHSWEDYLRQLTLAIREDLRANPQAFAELTTLAPADGPALTPLRALDIVVWMSQAAGH